VTPKGQTRDSNMLRVQYLENSCRSNLATIANYWIVCSEAVRSAILATAWLLIGRPYRQSRLWYNVASVYRHCL